MGCCKSLCGSLFKLILILINIPLLLIGLALMFAGIMTAFFLSTLVEWFTTLLQNQDANVVGAITDFLAYLDDFALGVGISLLVIGIIVFCLAFLGGCGACCSNFCLMVTYSVLVGAIAVGSLITAIIFLVDSTILTNPISQEFINEIEKSYDDPDNPNRKGNTAGIEPKMLAYASVFRLLPCCGVNDYKDFQKSKNWDQNYYYNAGQNVTAVIPVMCCKDKRVLNSTQAWPYSEPGLNSLDTTCITNPTADNSYIETSCMNQLTGGVNSVFAWVVFGMALGMLIIFFIAAAVTALVRKKSGSDDGYEMR